MSGRASPFEMRKRFTQDELRLISRALSYYVNTKQDQRRLEHGHYRGPESAPLDREIKNLHELMQKANDMIYSPIF